MCLCAVALYVHVLYVNIGSESACVSCILTWEYV